MEQSTKEAGKTIAIISYITVIGLIVAYFMNKNDNNAFANFHMKQSLKIFILAVLLNILATILINITGITLLAYIGYLPLILMVLGVMNAMNTKESPLPLIGTIGGI